MLPKLMVRLENGLGSCASTFVAVKKAKPSIADASTQGTVAAGDNI